MPWIKPKRDSMWGPTHNGFRVFRRGDPHHGSVEGAWWSSCGQGGASVVNMASHATQARGRQGIATLAGRWDRKPPNGMPSQLESIA